MPTLQEQPEWGERLLREARAGVIRCLFNYSVPPDVAWQSAEDAVPEAMSRALEREEQFVDYREALGWVTRTAINAAVDAARKRRRERPIPQGHDHDERFQLPPGPPGAWLALVRRFWEELPEEDRRILDFSYDEDATLNEIADRLGVGGNTPSARRGRVWTRRRAILDRLGERLLQAGFDPAAAGLGKEADS